MACVGEWTLGRWGAAVNFIAVSYTAFICFVLVMPPNELAAKTLGGVLCALCLVYAIEVRRKYQGPEWISSAAGDLKHKTAA
jgi:hypothetical protein